MYTARVKRGVFWVEGINALATTYYFYFIFFVLKRDHGFDDRQNLLAAAALGAVFCGAAILGGRMGQRQGYFPALGLGTTVMILSFVAGAFLKSTPVQVLVLLTAAFGMCFTWPNLEAMVSEKEPVQRLQRNLGIYNLIWSGGNGVAYFTGGAMLEYLGSASIFLVPAVMLLVQMGFIGRLYHVARTQPQPTGGPSLADIQLSTPKERKRSPVPPAAFLKMAWVANPFSYVAINTAVPLIPFLAGRLHLGPTEAGVVCSLWFFARTAAFGLLWRWDGWHYRYRFLSFSYVGMILGFVGILLANSVGMLILAQLLFGTALGLIYYSSLFYSMDVGETKGEHGGLHEAAIGAGIFAGPAVAFLALHFLPTLAQAGSIAVTLLLLGGFAWLNWLRWRKPD